MKCIRNAGGTVYSRVSTHEAAVLVETGLWVYTSKSAWKAWLNRTRKRFRSHAGNFPSHNMLRLLWKNKRRPRISNSKGLGVTKNLQRVLSGPAKIFVERYLPNHALKKIATGEITRKEAWQKYGKNRYKKNPNAKVVKTIKHITPRQGEVA